jgi:Lon protease-like protein
VAVLIPLFPLQHVLLPGMPLPLHIFQPRYRQLVADVSEPGHPGFGVVALRRGRDTDHDVAAADLADVGTVAEIVEREPYPDGRIDLLAVGTRRFRVQTIYADQSPYLSADVEWLPEEFGAVEPGLLPAVRSGCRAYLAALSRLGLRNEDDLAHDPLKLSYQVAAHLQLPLAERLALLAAPTVAERLDAERRLLRRETALLEATGTIPMPVQALRSVLGAD